VSTPQARSRFGGSGPFRARRRAGFTIVELLLVIAILTAIVVVVASAAFSLQASVSIRSAASQTAAAFWRARTYAITTGRYAGLKFRKNGDRYEWALYGDGNGNGIRNADIASGIDPSLGVYYPWTRNDVLPGIRPGAPDPSDPSRPLDPTDDPIRFGLSDICSFSPVGESSPGSVYLWDGRDRMAAIRIFGRTAKVGFLYWKSGEREWFR
jgi:type II secretory pathway pseudopilin PulG